MVTPDEVLEGVVGWLFDTAGLIGKIEVCIGVASE